MLEIIIQGRGGQGAQTAGNLLARAFFAKGDYVQVFASYGGARRGTPVGSYLRVDDKPIRRRCDIEKPDAILCFDASLLDVKLLDQVGEETVIVVNSPKPAEEFARFSAGKMYTIDGLKVSRENGLGKFINSTLLGAMVAILNRPDIDTMSQTIAESSPVKTDENVNACKAGFQIMQGLN
jgi:pyruvate ferredoxin oxidoreductase gamma subunit